MNHIENKCVHCNNLEECLWIAKRHPDFLRHCNYFSNITKALKKEGIINMHEYIKRTDAIAEINRGDLLVGNCAEWAREIIWRTPYADVAEVKHAYWVMRHRYFNTTYTCSKCKSGSMQKTNYCAECGARMDGEPWYE